MQEPYPQCHGGHGEIDVWLERQKALVAIRGFAAGARKRRRGGHLCWRLRRWLTFLIRNPSIGFLKLYGSARW